MSKFEVVTGRKTFYLTICSNCALFLVSSSLSHSESGTIKSRQSNFEIHRFRIENHILSEGNDGNSKPKRLRMLRQFAIQINFRICLVISDPAVYIPVCMSQPTTVSSCLLDTLSSYIHDTVSLLSP